MLATLALRNLTHDRTRLITATLGIAFAAFLMAMEGGLLYGFTMAASRVVDAVNADIWITAKGIPSMDFASPLPRRYRDIAMGAPGMARTGHAAVTWVPYVKPDGTRTMVLMVGLETPFLGRIPSPRLAAGRADRARDGLVIDETDVEVLRASGPARLVEVGERRAEVVHVAKGFSSFLGTPLVFADYEDARTYLNMPAERVSFVLGQVQLGADPARAVAWLRERLPDADVWTKSDFSTHSRVYWLVQTGAGGALSLAAILGFIIGLFIVSQTIFAITVEYIDEYATLKAVGAPPTFIRNVVRIQALVCGALGGVLGLLLSGPAMAAARKMVTWAILPWWMYPTVLASVELLCLLAARMAARPALNVEPGRVFRA